MTNEGSVRRHYIVAFLFLGVALGPSLAHLLELPNKIGLARDDYFQVQQIYRGWALLGIVVAGELLAMVTLALRLRGDAPAMRWAAVSLALIVVSQIIFWVFTYPTNAATQNWTRAPEDWEVLRVRWEYSHATAAVLNMAALLALAQSALVWGRRPAGEARGEGGHNARV